MYNTSDFYKYSIRQSTRESKISGEIVFKDGTTIQINDNDILAGSLAIDNACVNGQDYELGAVYMGQVQCTIFTQIDRYSLYGAKISLVYRLKLANNTYEEVPLGVYEIKEATRTDFSISIKAYDNMQKFERKLAGITTATPFEIYRHICQSCEVDMGMTQEEIDEMSAKYASQNVIPLRVNTANYQTNRDLLSDLAIILGGFATIDRNGALIIRRFKTDSTGLYENHIKKATVADYENKYDGIYATIDGKLYTAGETEGNLLEIQNGLWMTGEVGERQLIINNIWDVVKEDAYIPVEINYDGDPSIDLGDELTFTINGTEIRTILMSFNWKHKSGMKLVSEGKNPLLSDATSAVSKIYNQLQNEIDGGAFAVETWQNPGLFEINEEYTKIANIDCYTSKETTAIVHGQIEMDVERDDQLDIKYRTNGIYETWNPKFDVKEGKTLINIFCPVFIDRTGAKNNIEIFMKDSGTQLGRTGTIDVRKEYISVYGALSGTNSEFTGIVGIDQNIGALDTPHGKIKPIEEDFENE